MNEIIIKFLLYGDIFMPKIPRVLLEQLLKTDKEFKNLKKQKMKDIFIKTN